MAPLAYLRLELDQGGTFIAEWRALDNTTKEWYKIAAIAEMNLLGIVVK